MDIFSTTEISENWKIIVRHREISRFLIGLGLRVFDVVAKKSEHFCLLHRVILNDRGDLMNPKALDGLGDKGVVRESIIYSREFGYSRDTYNKWSSTSSSTIPSNDRGQEIGLDIDGDNQKEGSDYSETLNDDALSLRDATARYAAPRLLNLPVVPYLTSLRKRIEAEGKQEVMNDIQSARVIPVRTISYFNLAPAPQENPRLAWDLTPNSPSSGETSTEVNIQPTPRESCDAPESDKPGCTRKYLDNFGPVFNISGSVSIPSKHHTRSKVQLKVEGNGTTTPMWKNPFGKATTLSPQSKPRHNDQLNGRPKVQKYYTISRTSDSLFQEPLSRFTLQPVPQHLHVNNNR